MTSRHSSSRAYDRLSSLEKVSLSLVKDLFQLIDSDRYMDQIEDLVDTSDIDFETKDYDVVLLRRLNSTEEKVMLRTARALLNYYTSKPDQVAYLATHGDDA